MFKVDQIGDLAEQFGSYLPMKSDTSQSNQLLFFFNQKKSDSDSFNMTSSQFNPIPYLFFYISFSSHRLNHLIVNIATFIAPIDLLGGGKRCEVEGWADRGGGWEDRGGA